QQDIILVDSDFRAQYASGHLVFVHGGNLMTQSFDEKKLKLAGNPVPIAEQVRGETRGAAAFSLSSDGKLIFAGGQAAALDLAWYDPAGRRAISLTAGPSRTPTSRPTERRSLRRGPTPRDTWRFTSTTSSAAPSHNSVSRSPEMTIPSGLRTGTPLFSTPGATGRLTSIPGRPMAPARRNCSITTIWTSTPPVGPRTENTSPTKL